ncbi:hypothetical protein [Listeria innocua]|uniref:hypothetical protein n=1 Tax=Listeria innocua TaxID=1642 RepID=UPI00162A09D0|nr:hypothetical protein [Listeria innocua]MBC1925569.1 hypothetical protein [Listeria innocua]
MTLTKDQQQEKKLASLFLQAKGFDYEQELVKWHKKVIEDNQDVLVEALSAFTPLKNNDKKEKGW